MLFFCLSDPVYYDLICRFSLLRFCSSWGCVQNSFFCFHVLPGCWQCIYHVTWSFVFLTLDYFIPLASIPFRTVRRHPLFLIWLFRGIMVYARHLPCLPRCILSNRSPARYLPISNIHNRFVYYPEIDCNNPSQCWMKKVWCLIFHWLTPRDHIMFRACINMHEWHWNFFNTNTMIIIE